jgi:hypothetical protein
VGCAASINVDRSSSFVTVAAVHGTVQTVFSLPLTPRTQQLEENHLVREGVGERPNNNHDDISTWSSDQVHRFLSPSTVFSRLDTHQRTTTCRQRIQLSFNSKPLSIFSNKVTSSASRCVSAISSSPHVCLFTDIYVLETTTEQNCAKRSLASTARPPAYAQLVTRSRLVAVLVTSWFPLQTSSMDTDNQFTNATSPPIPLNFTPISSFEHHLVCRKSNPGPSMRVKIAQPSTRTLKSIEPA